MFEFEMLQISGLQPSLLINKLGLSAKTLSLLFSKIKVLSNGCWEWTAAKRDGYGAVKIRSLSSSTQQSHRICYQLVNGSIASSIPLHHKVEDGCIGPSCCNPSHLLETTTGEHTRDLTPDSISYAAAHRDHCQAGHPYTIENTRIVKDGTRQCRLCDKTRAQGRRDAVRVRPKHAKDPAKLKSHCKRGHLLEGDNIKMMDSPWGQYRHCIVCDQIRAEKYKQRYAMAVAGTLPEFIKPGPRQKDVCTNGHPMEGDNLYIRPDGTGRSCRACRLDLVKRYQANNREQYLTRRKELRSAAKSVRDESLYTTLVALLKSDLDDDTLISELKQVLKTPHQRRA